MKVVLGTIVLLLALAVAVFGLAVSQGERDVLLAFLMPSIVLAVTALVLFGWSILVRHRRG